MRSSAPSALNSSTSASSTSAAAGQKEACLVNFTDTPPLLIKDLDELILDYVEFDQTASQGYSPKEYRPKNRSLTFFEEQLPIRAWLQHVLRGEQEEAEAMLKANPELLLKEGMARDYSGRTIQGSAFQLALGAEDELMAKMISDHIRKLPNGEEILRVQYEKQFPAGWEEEKERAANDLQALQEVLKAIREAKPDDSYEAFEKACEPALIKFRKYLEKQAKNTIKTGKHFNVQLLIKAFELYNANYGAFGNHWKSPKNMLSWHKVIGYIQRYLPASYAQAFAQGFYYIVEKNEPLKRSLEFRDDKGYFFFPLSSFLIGLGYDYAVGIAGGCELGIDGRIAGWLGLVAFQNLCQAKTRALQNLCSAPTISQHRLA